MSVDSDHCVTSAAASYTRRSLGLTKKEFDDRSGSSIWIVPAHGFLELSLVQQLKVSVCLSVVSVPSS